MLKPREALICPCCDALQAGGAAERREGDQPAAEGRGRHPAAATRRHEAAAGHCPPGRDQPHLPGRRPPGGEQLAKERSVGSKKGSSRACDSACVDVFLAQCTSWFGAVGSTAKQLACWSCLQQRACALSNNRVQRVDLLQRNLRGMRKELQEAQHTVHDKDRRIACHCSQSATSRTPLLARKLYSVLTCLACRGWACWSATCGECARSFVRHRPRCTTAPSGAIRCSQGQQLA